MSNNVIDTIGETCWYLMFLTPLITLPIVFRYSKQSKLNKIIKGLLFAFILSFLFFLISWGILFRGGMGPV